MKITYDNLRVGIVSEEVSKSRRLKEFNNNYPKVIQQDVNGYTLASYDESGNEIKSQYILWKNKGSKTMAKIIVDSKWVKANVNVFEGDVLTIRSGGILEVSQLDPSKKEWHFDVELPDGTIKDAKFNKTSIVNLTEGFGTNDSAEWLGKEIIAKEIVKYAKGAGVTYSVNK